MPKKNKILKEYDGELYGRTPINNLILFSIYSVGKECTFERLLKECFILFPQAFSFSKYHQWPDSRKLDRPIRFLRNRKLITGNPKTFFSLTKIGKKLALETAKTLKQRKLKF